MTGYGKGIAEGNNRKITIELRAVNHRFLDIASKLPRGLNFCEDTIRKVLSKYLVRGHIDVYCSYEDNREGKAKIKLDTVIARKYQSIGAELELLGFVNDLTASQVLRMPEVLTAQTEEDDDSIIQNLLEEAMESACEKLLEMRKTEGRILKNDLVEKFNFIAEITDEITKRTPQVSENYAEKLKLRIAESLQNVAYDEARMINEVAFFVDKSNIDEEITRLKAHIKHGLSIMDEEGAVGKKMDFLVQEMNREINTMGSKSNDFILTEKVLLAKNEVEKIREQVQNIE